MLELGLGLGARAHSTLAWVLARIEGECACHSGAWPTPQRPRQAGGHGLRDRALMGRGVWGGAYPRKHPWHLKYPPDRYQMADEDIWQPPKTEKGK